MPSAKPTSVCLLRLSALGDVCNTVPLVRTLQQAWPEARLTWIIGRAEHRLVQSLPGVEFIVFNKKAGLAAWSHVRRQLQGRRFDILLHAQVSARANLLSLLVRARRRIGFDRQRSREGHGLVINERINESPFQHQAVALRSFAEHLGLSTDAAERTLPVTDAGRAFALRYQPEADQAVLISPASSHPGRNWHATGYARVADWIVQQAGRPVILVGGPSVTERDLGEQILRETKAPVLNLIGQDTLDQALAMMERAACVISPDAGPAHFAAAMGTPVVGLYAATWSRRSGPLGSLEHCVDRYPEAARKFTGKPPEALRWGRRLEYPRVMDLIRAEDVVVRLQPLLMAQ
ncbi:glycosyltransferase family 9 protein [Wenzhouxiangella limi]|uniref:Glycosyltransferase family 9 protein n=1 Tax=Wenzhouxiangella limi TaxID=2707351 RepID=A0A845V901_9GAMM|nr:glycosyltransferase family 9 protein [Wenzhouxiangella limi]NDY96631.1 glycosyltransferase family 9 protein [Wenzhouxiangella limi]